MERNIKMPEEKEPKIEIGAIEIIKIYHIKKDGVHHAIAAENDEDVKEKAKSIKD